MGSNPIRNTKNKNVDIKKYAKDELIKIINNSNSYREFLYNIGYSSSGNAYRVTQKYLDSIKIDYTNLVKNRWSSKERSIEDVLVEGVNFCNKSLKTKILKYKVLDYKCVECGNEGEWMGKPITLQLDHINGVHNDNRIENLRFMCPNCHSQTDTHGGKNNKK